MKNIFIVVITSFFVLSCGPNSNLYEILKPASPPEPSAPLGLALTPYFVGLESSFPQHEARTKADVVLTIENSGSMINHLDVVERDIGSLMTRLHARGISFRIGVIKSVEDNSNHSYRTAFFGSTPWVESTDSQAESKIKTNIREVKTSFQGGQERPVWSSIEAYHDITNRGFFRADAATNYIIVSDAKDTFYTVKEFGALFTDFTSHSRTTSWMLSHIGSPEAAPCDHAEDAPDLLIEQLSRYSGGRSYRFCDLDYAAHFSNIASDIAGHLNETIMSVYIPSGRYVDGQNMLVRVAGNVINNDSASGYVWNPFKESLSFPGTFAPTPGQTVEVYFEYLEL